MAAFEACQPRVRALGLPELVELPVPRIHEDDVAIAHGLALELLQGLPGSRKRLRVLVPVEGPVLDGSVVGKRKGAGIGLVRVVEDLHLHPLLVGGNDDEVHVEVVLKRLVRSDTRDHRRRGLVDGQAADVLVPGMVRREDLKSLQDRVGFRSVEQDGPGDLRHGRPGGAEHRRRDEGKEPRHLLHLEPSSILRSRRRPSFCAQGTATIPASLAAPVKRQSGEPGAKFHVSCRS